MIETKGCTLVRDVCTGCIQFSKCRLGTTYFWDAFVPQAVFKVTVLQALRSPCCSESCGCTAGPGRGAQPIRWCLFCFLDGKMP